MENLLKDLGLTENQSRLYLAFLTNGEKVAADVAKELKMDKSSAYRAAEELAAQGLLIAKPKKRGTTYTAANPEVLRELLKKKQLELEKQSTNLNVFIEQLNKLKDNKRNTFILVEKGIGAIQQSMNRTLESASKNDKIIREKYRLDYPYFKNPDHIEFVNDFVRRRIKLGVSIKQLVNFAGQDVFKSIMKNSPDLLKEIRLTPKGLDDYQAIRIGGENVTIITFDKNKDYVVITINDPYVSQFMKIMFDFIWERSQIYKET